ncbi:serine/threonine-protein kinase [bacterium]|nr:serine/threonine-protein kinase [bacterium]
MIGKTLAHYKVTEKIGAGGMGEVYRATDTKLGRDVALKMLPAAFAQDAERMARFQREAQVLASLNHPNIGAIYGLDEHDGARFLVLELIEGPTLFDRLAAGRIPQEEAIAIARQIAEAVEFAHENGVVHRDLKPANIKVTEDGRVKVLDFGLAKALEDPAASTSGADLAKSPTFAPTLQSPITGALTGPNVILGTAAYMSPEQARGKPLDRRTDIFSFGCVFFETLTGRRTFDGETVSDVLARILEREPEWSALPESTPERARRILRRCLEKDPRQRQRDIGDVRIALQEIEETRVSSARAAVADAPRATDPASRRSLAVAWTVAALAALVAVGSFLLPRARTTEEEPGQVVRFEVTAPPGARMFGHIGHSISPDGTALLWPGTDTEGRRRTWIRRLDSLESRPLPSIASPPAFWAPDGQSIGYVDDGKLRTMRLDGGEPRTLCDVNSYRGASWGANAIVFAGGQGPIYKMPVTGGTPEAVTTVDAAKGETAHRYPHFLPDGKTFLFVALPGKHRVLPVYAGHVDGREPVFVTRSLISPAYSSGHLVFQRGRRLLAQAFDPVALALSGEPIDLGPAPELWEASGSTKVSASRNGTLAYVTPRDPNTKLVWRDLDSKEPTKDRETLDLDPGAYTEIRFSPDGRYVALVREVSPEESDIWVLELERNILTRFTQGPGNHGNVGWSPDGAWIAYSTDADGPWNIYRRPFPGSGDAEPVVVGPTPFKNVMDWSPDGKFLLYSAIGTGTNMDLWVAPADGSGEPRPYLAEAHQENNGHFSPDGRWIVYVSEESGVGNVYINSFPEPGRKRRVSIDGGFEPRWTADGTGIRFFSPDNKMVVASVQTEPSLRTGIPEELFTLDREVRGGDITTDGGRALVIKPVEVARDAGVTVVVNRLRQLGRERP